jgi:hypothetical protein
MKTKSFLTVALVSFLSFLSISVAWATTQTQIIFLHRGLNNVTLTVQPVDPNLNDDDDFSECVGEQLAKGLMKGASAASADVIYKRTGPGTYRR